MQYDIIYLKIENQFYAHPTHVLCIYFHKYKGTEMFLEEFTSNNNSSYIWRVTKGEKSWRTLALSEVS